MCDFCHCLFSWGCFILAQVWGVGILILFCIRKKLLIAEGVQTLQGFAMNCCGGQLQNTGKYLKREEFGGLKLDDELEEGEYRELTDDELTTGHCIEHGEDQVEPGDDFQGGGNGL